MPSPPAQRSISGISLSFTPLSATALILMARPAFCAAFRPSLTLGRSPQRVIWRNLA